MNGWTAIGLMTVLAVACAGSGWVEPASEPGTGPTMTVSGVVHRLEVEGGVWVIRDPQGTSFQPTNLPERFRKEGMPVEAEARRRDNVASIGMAGTIVDIVRIRQRPGQAP